MKDYYKILGVPENADEATVKQAYRALAKQYHPDINSDAGATEKFKLITEAYAILSDPIKRARYNRMRASGLELDAERIFKHYSGKDLMEAFYRQAYLRRRRNVQAWKRYAMQAEQRLFRYAMKVLLTPVFLVICFVTGFYIYKQYFSGDALEREGKATSGIIYFISEAEKASGYAYYVYYVSGLQYSGFFPVQRVNGETLTDKGLPVRHGDTFEVLYLENRPDQNRLRTDRPTGEQLSRYRYMAIDKCVRSFLDAYPLSEALGHCDCVVTSVLKHYGTDGILHIYFQDMPSEANLHYNEKTFQKLAGQKEYASISRVCRELYFGK